MRTFEGVASGYILGSLMMAGVWAFIELDRRPRSCFGDLELPPVEKAAVAPRPAPPPLAAEPPPSKQRGPRREVRRAARAVVEPVAAPRLDAARTLPTEPAEVVDDERTAPRVLATHRPRRAGRAFGVALSAGLETSLSPGPGSAAQWQLRLFVEPTDHLGFEVGYVGLRGPSVAASSVEALATWYPTARQALRPYVLGGLGWRRWHAPRKTDVAMAPLGAGLTYTRGPWRADTRLTLRLASQSGLDTVGASAHLGRSF